MVRAKIRSLGGNERGSAAVEFALIAPMFFALLFSILEAGWFFFVSSAVEQANANAARLIRTGQVQNGGVTREAFFDEICNVVDAFGDCAQTLTVDVSRYATFDALSNDLNATVCRDADDDAVDGIPYDAGGQREIVRVRVCFLYKPINPGIGLNLDKTGDGHRKIVSVSIFRNEPYED
jgi:Flp pilus assembly protein TadG